MPAAAAAVVHRPREQLLAGAGLAQDHHRGVGRGHFQHAAERDTQRRRIADDVLEVVAVTNLVPASACRAAGTARQAGELARLLGALKRNRDEVGKYLESGGDLRRPQHVAV